METRHVAAGGVIWRPSEAWLAPRAMATGASRREREELVDGEWLLKTTLFLARRASTALAGVVRPRFDVAQDAGAVDGRHRPRPLRKSRWNGEGNCKLRNAKWEEQR